MEMTSLYKKIADEHWKVEGYYSSFCDYFVSMYRLLHPEMSLLEINTLLNEAMYIGRGYKAKWTWKKGSY